MKTNTLDIEWKHLDRAGLTCERCGDTGDQLRSLAVRLARCCAPDQLRVQLRETKLTADQLNESNAVLFNGRAIEDILPQTTVTETDCPSCTQLTGAPAECRALLASGERHEVLALSLLWQAATKVLGCDCPLPEFHSPIPIQPTN